ncbi:tape measure protein [uncultured Gilvimarinus sp.]|uniref:tape measure protein n=1 Tax=uncultured Gilvimarinus sp. TaxID=1689143 RepID=UPI0030DB56B2
MSDLKLSIKLTTEGGKVVVKEIDGVEQAATDAAHALDKTDKSGRKAKQGLDQAGKGARETDNAIDRLNKRLTQAVTVGALFYAGMRAFQGVRVMADIADDTNVLRQRVRTATKETGEFYEVWDALYTNAQDNGAAMQSTVELFQRLSIGKKELQASTEEMLVFTDAVQQLGVIGGSSTEAMKFGLGQLSQAMSGDIVRAEEFNSVLENIPELAQRVAEGMGDLGVGELRRMVLEGEVLSKDVFQAILSQIPEINAEFEGLDPTLRRTRTAFDNAFGSALARFDEASGATQGWITLLQTATDALDGMDTDEMQAALSAALQTGELLAYTLTAVGTVALAKYAAAQLPVIRNTLFMNTASVRTVNALGQVRVAAATSTVSMNALGMATRFALGPIGLLIATAGLAVTAFSSYYDGATDAQRVTKELATELDGATQNFNALSDATIEQAIAGNAAKLETAREKVADLRAELKQAEVDWRAQAEAARTTGAMNASAGQQMMLSALKQKERMEELQGAVASAAGAHQDLRRQNEKLNEQLKKNRENRAAGEEKAEAEALTKAMLSLYNAQRLNAAAVDEQGRALDGIDLELFKAEFEKAKELPEDATAAIREFAKASAAAQASLALDAHLDQLREQIGLMDVRLEKGQAEADIQKQLAQYTGASPEQLETLREEIALITRKQALADDQTTLESLRAETDLLRIRLEQGEDEYAIQKALFQLKGGNPDTLAAIEDELRAQQELNEQIRITEELAGGGFGDMRDELGEISDAVKELGGNFVNAFGDAAALLDAMTESQADYAKGLEKIAKERVEVNTLWADSADKQAKLNELQQRETALNRQNYTDQISQYGALAGAASEMFGVQSRERENLHKIEMAFGAVELAMALQKASANALTAITSSFAAPFPVNFAAGAAMIGIMAGLGVFNGGGNVNMNLAADRQDAQGTGTVLGDSTAKSSSIENTFDRIEELELDQYQELRQINENIKALSGGISRLAISLVQDAGRFNDASYSGQLGTRSNINTGGLFEDAGVLGTQMLDPLLGTALGNWIGDPLGGLIDDVFGGFSETTRELIDSGITFDAQTMGQVLASGTIEASYYNVIKETESSWWGLSEDSSQNTEYSGINAAVRASMGKLFGYVGGSVTDAIDILGLNPQNMIDNFAIDLPNVSFKDLSGDEIEAELQAIFSQQADLMTQYLVPGVEQYQKMNEGLYETLLRVAQEQAVYNAQMDALGLTMGSAAGITAAAQLEISQSIITLTGGIEAFRDATADYLNAFYSGAEQFDYLSGTLQQTFTDLGQPLPATRDGFRALVDGIDRTTTSGQQLFATLLQLAPSMDEFYSVLNDRAEFETSMAGELTALDATALQQSLTDLNAWYDEQIAAAEELGAETTMLERLYGRKRADIIADELAAINEQHTTAAEKLVSEYEQVFGRIDSLASSISGDILSIQRAGVGWNEVGYQNGIIGDLRGNLGVGDASDQIGTIEGLQSAIMARYEAEMARNSELQQAEQARHQQLQAAAQQRYQAEKAAYDAMRNAADQLLQAADAMLLSAASPALLGSQLSEAQSQFSNLSSKAQGGDADAAGQLQGVGSSYLDIAKSYYAQGSDEYKAIFEQIQNAYRNVGATVPDEPPEPVVPSVVRNYQSRDAKLQQSAINELTELQTLLDDLREQEQTALEAQQAEMLATQEAQIAAVNQSTADIVNAIQTTQARETDRMIMEMRFQRDEARKQSASVVKELGRVRSELNRTQDVIYNDRRTG